jgi:hypothetical protein
MKKRKKENEIKSEKRMNDTKREKENESKRGKETEKKRKREWVKKGKRIEEKREKENERIFHSFVFLIKASGYVSPFVRCYLSRGCLIPKISITFKVSLFLLNAHQL